jgi:hypothetical protein
MQSMRNTFSELGEPGMRFLNAEQIRIIDEALRSLGDFGELRLVVEKGRLRFLVTQKSYDALKVSPGAFEPME